MPEASHGTELFDILREMDLPTGSYAIFGSGPLLARGIIDSVNDLDVICLPPAWDRACQLGELVNLSDGVQIISTHGGTITFGRNWRYGSFDIAELVATAEEVNGLPFVGIEHVVTYKRVAGRPKDLLHLQLIAAYLAPESP